MQLKSRRERRSVYEKGCTRKNRPNPASFTLPHLYLSKVLNIPKSLAAHYRYIAVKSGFISSKHTFELLNIPSSEKEQFKKYYCDYKNLRINKKKLALQKNDILISNIVLKNQKWV